jgi:hypothetical protein
VIEKEDEISQEEGRCWKKTSRQANKEKVLIDFIILFPSQNAENP